MRHNILPSKSSKELCGLKLGLFLLQKLMLFFIYHNRISGDQMRFWGNMIEKNNIFQTREMKLDLFFF